MKIRRVNRVRKIYANVASFITLDDTFESEVEVFGKSFRVLIQKILIHFWTFLSQAGWWISTDALQDTETRHLHISEHWKSCFAGFDCPLGSNVPSALPYWTRKLKYLATITSQKIFLFTVKCHFDRLRSRNQKHPNDNIKIGRLQVWLQACSRRRRNFPTAHLFHDHKY